jgi:pimeloyl-ACP methyl ester carboxylesterase
MTTMLILETAEADIAYDVHGPLPTADGRPPLFMIAPTLQADDVHAVIATLGVGPVEMFASSGGAVTALALVAAYPNDVTTLVAHEPPLIPVLPDAEAAERARAVVRDAYEAKGSSAGMAAFIAMTSWRGEFTDDYFAQPAPDPAQFGMPTEDDGSRDDPLLSDRSWAISSYRPEVEALAAAPTRVVVAVGEESLGTSSVRDGRRRPVEQLARQAKVWPGRACASRLRMGVSPVIRARSESLASLRGMIVEPQAEA